MRVEELVGRRVRESRETVGLTQEQLGQSLQPYLGKKWPGQQVSVAEDGGRKFTAAELFALSMVLDRPVSYFFIPISVTPIEAPGGAVPVDEATSRQIWGPSKDSVAPIVVSVLQRLPGFLGEMEQSAREARQVVDDLLTTLFKSLEEKGE